MILSFSLLPTTTEQRGWELETELWNDSLSQSESRLVNDKKCCPSGPIFLHVTETKACDFTSKRESNSWTLLGY